MTDLNLETIKPVYRPSYKKNSLQTPLQTEWEYFLSKKLKISFPDNHLYSDGKSDTRFWNADVLSFTNGVVLGEFNSPHRGFFIHENKNDKEYFSMILFSNSVNWYEKSGETHLHFGGIAIFDHESVVSFRTDVTGNDIVILMIPYRCFESQDTINILKTKRKLIFGNMLKEIFIHITTQDKSVYRKINVLIDLIEMSAELEEGSIYRRVLQAIEDNCCNIDFNFSTLCEISGVSRREIRELLKINNTSFLSELSRIRVNILVDKLSLNSNKRLIDLCHDSGFNSYCNALTQFKKYKGCTFSEYKRRINL